MGKADAEWVERSFQNYEEWDETRRELIEALTERANRIEDALDTIRNRLDEIAEKLEERPTTDKNNRGRRGDARGPRRTNRGRERVLLTDRPTQRCRTRV